VRIVIALGGNALMQPGDEQTVARQHERVRATCHALAPIAGSHELVITHGNGPQVGRLALQNAAYAPAATDPLDVLGAETEGMLGYLLEQELRNALPAIAHVTTLVTLVEVAASDPAFAHPTKPIGPVYDARVASALARQHGWSFANDHGGMRRVVPSPQPQAISGVADIELLLEHGRVVICAGGGGVPVTHAEHGLGRRLVGVDGVIDKDLTSAVLAHALDADALVIATDVDAVYDGYGTPDARAMRRASPAALARLPFASGSMAPKIAAVCRFVHHRGRFAAIGSLDDVGRMVRREAGTIVDLAADSIEYAPPAAQPAVTRA
jgi:carbamate kinase